jgi:hypothetical protein
MTAKIIKFPSCGTSKEAYTFDDYPLQSSLSICIEPILSNTSPERTVILPSDGTLADLHELIALEYGWDDEHNYFFSQGSYRYEDPELFYVLDRITTRCQLIYSADRVPAGVVLFQTDMPLYYVYNLTNNWEVRIKVASVNEEAPLREPVFDCLSGKESYSDPSDMGFLN